MTPTVSTPETRRLEAIREAAIVAAHPMTVPEVRTPAVAVVACGPDATIEAIAAAGWCVDAAVECYGCGRLAAKVVTVGGEEREYVARETILCRPCLLAALAALDAAP